MKLLAAEIGVGAEHALDRVQELAHNGHVGLEGLLAAGNELAAIESAAQKDTDEVPSELAAHLVREATRRGFESAPRPAVRGDGAKWIWNLASEYVPGTIQIVDRFHAKQHLSDVATSLYGAGSELGTQWAHARHEELDAGDIEALVRALRTYAPQDEEARRCIG